MDFISITIEALRILSKLAGSYGLGIILLTIIVRVAMWPLGVSQQRSMKQMQTLQPRMKAIQERYKNDPQTMQRKMMEFYKEHNFNPMSGCLPLLIQMPIFILLYSTLMSPQFIKMAGNAPFLFVNSLDSTLRTSAGISKDGIMGVSTSAKFMAGKTANVYLKQETLKDVKIAKPNEAIEIQGAVHPGEPIELKFEIDNFKDLKFSQLDQVEKAEIEVTNIFTKESETVTFEKKGSYLMMATVPTKAVESTFHFDVLALIVIFGLTMVFTQKAMMAMNKNQELDPTQAAMQKSMNMFMPIMLCGTFVLIPIPAGVLLYLISSNIVQIVQTVLINKKLELEFNAKKDFVSDDEVAVAKQIKAKD